MDLWVATLAKSVGMRGKPTLLASVATAINRDGPSLCKPTAASATNGGQTIVKLTFSISEPCGA